MNSVVEVVCCDSVEYEVKMMSICNHVYFYLFISISQLFYNSLMVIYSM